MEAIGILSRSVYPWCYGRSHIYGVYKLKKDAWVFKVSKMQLLNGSYIVNTAFSKVKQRPVPALQ
jgi:hypothetical protein